MLRDMSTTIHERRTVPRGHVIIKQGDVGVEGYLIQSGAVRVYAVGSGGKIVDLGKLGPGQIFGEMSLMGESPRAATVEALEECTLIRITEKMLRDKLLKSDPTVRAMLPMLMERLRQSNSARLKLSGSLEEMSAAIRDMYKNMQVGLPPQRVKTMENTVKPAMEEFLDALAKFHSNS